MRNNQSEDGWYVLDQPCAQGKRIWHFKAGTAVDMGVSNPHAGPGTYFAAGANETIWDAIERGTGWLAGGSPPGPFIRLGLPAGHYYPRMARPDVRNDSIFLAVPNEREEHRYLITAQTQIEALVANLQAIIRVVHPSTGTLAVFGHEIRNLLILAATEVEMHWRGIMKVNGVTKDAYSTNDYIKLLGPLRLAEYSVRFPACPDIGTFRPFALWNRAQPTQSIPWYADYNAVKHNREHAFEKATLESAFNAVAACAILLMAQFGAGAFTQEIVRFVQVEILDWAISDMYLEPYGGSWVPVQHLELK